MNADENRGFERPKFDLTF